MKIRGISITLLILAAVTGMAQEPTRELSHRVSFKSQYVSIKDGYNYGLAHNGLNLAGTYSLTSASENNVFSYETEIAFGANYKQGVGLAWTFKPFDFFYGFRLNNNPDLTLILGPYLSGSYRWHLYPELQSGHMLWFSSYETGAELRASVPLEQRLFTISVASSLFALNSRPQTSPESYFYSLTFNDFVSNVHSHMKAGSIDIYQHFQIKLALSNINRRFRIGYGFEYQGYSRTPKYQYLTHSVNLIWRVGNKNKN